MSVLIAHASIGENNKVKNGVAGDQTGKEVCIRSWYNKPWNVLIRFTDEKMANKLADCMENACKNNAIGYDQNQRNTLLREARKYNYDVSKVKVPCETDCSALVSVACMYAGIPESTLTLNGNCATTRTLRQILKSTGKVEMHTTSSYLTSTERLKRGDILLKEGSHVVVVVKVDEITKTLDEIAQEVIAGKWGNGSVRRANLTEAGYNYAMVQAKVSELLNSKVTDIPLYVWNYFMDKIKNPYGVAGLMGNLQAESGLNPKNMQNSYERKLGYDDNSYTTAVDNGSYSNFIKDGVGYGIAQWTYWTRKKALLQHAKGKSIGDIKVQTEFLYKELSTSYKGVLNKLKQATSVKTASEVVLKEFEKPKVQSDAVLAKRTEYGQTFYDKYKS